MRHIKKIQIVIIVAFLLLFTKNTIAIGGGSTDHLTDPIPEYGEEDVDLSNPKGVQTCINVTVDSGCTVNLTFQWFNYTDPDPFTWGWEIYGYLENVAVSGQYCFWNLNVSCATENYWSEWFHWRVVANFTCQQADYQEIMYLYFNPEDCPLFYIYPVWNSTDSCPCCDAMCIGINNVAGNNINVTFYRNDSQFETFYIVNRYINITNGTYCFCLDGHLNNSIYYPMRYNTTYHWYVNVTDITTGEYNVSNTFWFTTAEHLEDCFCGNISELEEELGGEKDWVWTMVPGAVAFALLCYMLFKRKEERRKK